MIDFDYTFYDLDKDIKDVLGNDLEITQFGLSELDYVKVDKIEFELSQNKAILDDDLIKNYGFVNMNIFMDYYCRAHLWNNYSTNTNKTIREILKFYYNKAKKYHALDNVPEPTPDGNLLHYLKQFKIKWLISVGW
jgi:hypothetical protein